MRSERSGRCATGSVRVAVFLDLENLCGGRHASTDDLLAHAATILGAARGRATVAAAVGYCNRALASRVALPLARLGIRVFVHDGGPDAADVALIARMRAEIPRTVDTVVIASGDHIFADVARELRARGMRVEVCALAGCLSADLYRAADDCVLLRSA